MDVLSGGFPCQPFSNAGVRKGTEDPRHLFPYIARGIRECQPRIVFLENVEGIISAKTADGESVLQYVLRELEGLGYQATAGIFSASEVGAPHQSKSVFILGYKNQKKKNWATPRASATDSTRPNGKGGIPLADQVKNWATPNTMDTLPPRSYEAAMRQATTSRKGRTEPSNLREQVDETTVQAYKDANSFPTPRTSDAEGGRIETIVEDGVFKSKRHKSNQTFGAKLRDAVETYEEKNWPTPQVGEEKASRPRILGGTQNQVMLSQVAIEDSIARTQDSQQDQTSHSTSGKPQGAPKLNPDWVEQLMGLPIGSTDLGYWGTGSCHK